jgi:glycosyltransferase involved in cell wall biosynthesis
VSGARLVSVVIPAYNAAATLDETLRSVRAQTHRALEIIVVDDGSTDDTLALAQRHASADPRVQVLHQPNAGVAAARNAGWQHAGSQLIAFVDADDLWAPTKIELQLAAFDSGGERVGLVYCWFARIDRASRIIDNRHNPVWQGDVRDMILTTNFVGNGSAALICREALVAARGFDTGLQAQGAHGCEDYLLYFRVAEAYNFALVPQPLVGYRSLPGNMSDNRPRMLRSWMLVHDEMVLRRPGHARTVKQGVRNYAGWLFDDARSSGATGQLMPLLWLMLTRCPGIGLRVLWDKLLRPAARRLLGRPRRRQQSAAEHASGGVGGPFTHDAAES